MDPAIASSERGLWALKWSLAGLGVTAGLQAVIVVFTGSVALLADTVHNVGDALSAVLAAYESIRRLFDPQDVELLWAVAAAGVIGFAGNEAVAAFRIRVGRQIGSAALVADGYHARTDGLTSLAVVAGASGVALGWPAADPVVGLLISAVILKIVWDASRSIGERLLDGIDPAIGAQIHDVAAGTDGVKGVRTVRARRHGHVIRAEIDAEVDGGIGVAEGHRIGERIVERLRGEVEFFGDAVVRVTPARP